MKIFSFGITEGGEHRLREAIEAQVMREHREELAAVTDKSEKTAIEKKIQQVVKQKMGRIASPYSLWNSQFRA